MAEKGAVFMNENQAYFANVPIGKVKNSVGSGDSVVAGFIAGYMQHQDFQKAFQKGVASGSATAFSEDLGTKEYAEQLLNEINVSEI
jgi:1-phosphofructokinase